jgi:hypothetical protein
MEEQKPGGVSGMDPGPGLQPQFGGRILVVGTTWLLLTGCALLFGPNPVLALGVLPLGIALRMAWRSRHREGWHSPDSRMRRQITHAAVLLAGGLLSATLWSIRAMVPVWLIWAQAGALMHYWLLGMADSSHR